MLRVPDIFAYQKFLLMLCLLQNRFVTIVSRMQPSRPHFSAHDFTTHTETVKSSFNFYRVYLGVGSNLGDRFGNIRRALSLLTNTTGDTRIVRTSFIHQTAPMYVTDQPVFWNGAVVIETNMEPQSMIQRIKEIETSLGRNIQSAIRNGPRPVDLDILFYQKRQSHVDAVDTWEHLIVNNSAERKDGELELVVPHPRMQERDFVLIPLLEVAGQNFLHPTLKTTLGELRDSLELTTQDDAEITGKEAVRVLPLPRERSIVFDKTVVMGILNVAPDSFSDGGLWNTSIESAVERALEMVQEGADVIDVGGESTRPGAKPVNSQEEIQRTVPVIEAIRAVSDIPISIDTRRADVARAAINAGADLVNDVSGGTFDPMMLSTVAEFGVPMVLMHMRGTPETMQSMTEYRNVVDEVAQSLSLLSTAAENSGIHRWQQIVDPGIGFAKSFEGNLLLLRHLSVIRKRLDDLPVLLGTSRKGFLGRITGADPDARDPATIASCVAALCLEGRSNRSLCSIVRVHNVDAFSQAAAVMDAIR